MPLIFTAIERTKLRPTTLTALLLILFLSGSLWLPASSLYAQDKQATAEDALTMLGTLKSKKISESSGLARSNFFEDAWWTMNDSGHGADVFMFGDQGKTLAACELKGAKNRDWEAMSSFQRGGKHYILVADVGDNIARRERCQLYIFEEPKFKPKKKKSYSKKLKSRRFEFRYEDGPRNCEAVACDPDGQSVFLIEKIFLETNKRSQPGIYQLKLPFNGEDAKAQENPEAEAGTEATADTLLVAKRIGAFPFRGVTGMSISPNGKRLAIRNYLSAHLFERVAVEGKLPTWEQVFRDSKPKSVPMPLQVQGEAICFTRDNEHLVVTSETARQTIWKVRVAAQQSSPED